MDKTDRLRNYGLAFLLYKQGLGVCGYELIRELFIFIKLILNSYLYYYNSKFQMTLNYFFCVFENEYGASLSAVPRCLLGSDAMS